MRRTMGSSWRMVVVVDGTINSQADPHSATKYQIPIVVKMVFGSWIKKSRTVPPNTKYQIHHLSAIKPLPLYLKIIFA